MTLGEPGVPKDAVEAVKWYRRAAERGHVDAQYAVGKLYNTTEGIRDYVQAHLWLDLAVSHMPASDQRKRVAAARDKLARLMTPAQIEEARRLARAWKPKT